MKREFITLVLWADREDGERVYFYTVFHNKRRAEQKIGELYMNGLSFNYRILNEEPNEEELSRLSAELIKGLK